MDNKICFYSRTLWSDDPCLRFGTALTVSYWDGEFFVTKTTRGEKVDYDYAREGIQKLEWVFKKSCTEKLMGCLGAHDGKELVDMVYERFHSYGLSADYYIKDYCRENDICYLVSLQY